MFEIAELHIIVSTDTRPVLVEDEHRFTLVGNKRTSRTERSRMWTRTELILFQSTSSTGTWDEGDSATHFTKPVSGRTNGSSGDVQQGFNTGKTPAF